jgi:endonuclease/exonuclease/phosphatase family protein
VKRLAFFGIAALLTAACQSDRLVNPDAANAAASSDGPAASQGWSGGSGLPAPDGMGLRVMAYNLYLGTNFNPVFQATGDEELLTAVARAYAELQQTNFPERAGRIAAQIAKVRPDLLGIEEVALWSVSPDYTPGLPPGSPFVVQYDFLQLLLDSLTARGLHYTAPAVDTTSDVAAPVVTAFTGGVPSAFILARFQDREAVLVRQGVSYSDPQHGVYQAAVGPLSIGGQDVYIKSGWSSVRSTDGGRTFRFVATHLDAEVGLVNDYQSQELVGLLQGETNPVILVGDFNSGPGVKPDFTPAYQNFAGAGFSDLWLLNRPRSAGLTNGELDGVGSLDENGVLVPYPTLTFDTRVDLVLLRDPLGPPIPVHAATFGYLQGDRTASGLWPSDHAAVGMVFELNKHLAGK